MMICVPINETSKTRPFWGTKEISVLSGDGIDIGCGPDPVQPDAVKFDLADGDANHITRFIKRQFDYVYSSHCLEHMRDAHVTLADWWNLVKPGGHLFLIVPDEDLYEQGVWPSRFNPDHRSSFTLSKAKSWSPVSVNVRELVLSLPGADIVSLEVQAYGYDQTLRRHGPDLPIGPVRRLAFRYYAGWRRRNLPRLRLFEYWQTRRVAIDQTTRPDALAQIQCIVRKAIPRSQPSDAKKAV